MPDGQGKAPLDNTTPLGAEARAERFAEIERRQGDTVGRKEMAMTRRSRDEDQSKRRAEKFLDIERRQDS
jgi:hypothetical protein